MASIVLKSDTFCCPAKNSRQTKSYRQHGSAGCIATIGQPQTRRHFGSLESLQRLRVAVLFGCGAFSVALEKPSISIIALHNAGNEGLSLYTERQTATSMSY